MHAATLTKIPAPGKVSFAPLPERDNGSLRLRLASLRQSALTRASQADFTDLSQARFLRQLRPDTTEAFLPNP